MTRKTPPAYSDGVYMMSGQDRPSPRKLSSLFMKGSDGLPSARNRTAMLAFFGEKTTNILFIYIFDINKYLTYNLYTNTKVYLFILETQNV